MGSLLRSKVYFDGPQSDSWHRVFETVWGEIFGESLIRVTKIRQSSFVVVTDHTFQSALPQFIRTLRNKMVRRKRKFVLIRGEPRVVMPLNYGIYSRFYDLVVPLGSLKPTGEEFEVRWPWNPPESALATVVSGKKGACLINANKLGLVAGELYSLRKQAAKDFDDISLFGPGWGMPFREKTIVFLKALLVSTFGLSVNLRSSLSWFQPDPTSYGLVPDKFDVIKRFKVSLVIENSATYVSEKLLDAIAGGTIPVYVGPNISKISLLDGLYVPSGPTLGEIRDQIDLALAMDLEDFWNRRKNFLESDELKSFTLENVVKEVVTRMHALPN